MKEWETRKGGDGEDPEMRNAECGMRNLKRGIARRGDTEIG